MFAGTERVRQGDFTHKIDIRAHDQLGELALPVSGLSLDPLRYAGVRPGPIAPGQTLSEVAAQVRPDAVSVNQMMIALLRANPGAFDHNGFRISVIVSPQALSCSNVRPF